jgi:hypothetical protein
LGIVVVGRHFSEFENSVFVSLVNVQRFRAGQNLAANRTLKFDAVDY